MRIKDILQIIETLAPLPLQEDYDNSGIQVGDTNKEATGALFCIDVTEDVIDEAISLKCNLIISHHPIAFKPFKSLTGRNYVERCMIKAIKNDIALYAAHTNLDNAKDGVNFKLASMLGLENVKILTPKKNALLKFVTTVPHSHEEIVRNAMFNAGAGHIGNYDSCSYNLDGEGTFKAKAGANPHVGEIDELHFESEVRIETVVPIIRKDEVMRALIAVHPYEEPVFDLYPITNDWNQNGSGITGVLPEGMSENDFLYMLKDVFKLHHVSYSRLRGKEIREVAVCGGSGSFLIGDAINYGADVLVTGEAKYNDFYDVEDKLLLASIGHYESEICTKELFYDVISKKYPNFAMHLSAFDSNPVNYL
ncbi:MAG: Nif3-like dinuclear metal center hexameric protein [Dysgonamonadaceae bacterium]|jgi:dinuclear metal center YbgI/SA1388 family protein|nr:Nif3-like dinuclear metal center hexameric protein [Dysgonamonadaceae bacterium]MDD3355461.1 Nif3-like dinuclear metal center hexameric protein [Dysgonamonadaceae bacterium]MDD3726769.1 Nif3-like dinuclear metal center hexameric protein [Dysgonamonadaceae bacterium]MDD4247390.1 Nif3-like dinuclear metal center hexameric protein [Dysgonamonadaceae bacterium]MDD4605475.1 Nif3-like dinuclear metal center hexameric protein [Dysgonamonadaceae bacterium]